MAIVQQIDEVQGITDTKVSKILNQMRTIINDLTNRSGKKITALAGNADIGGVTNKVNEIIASLQGTNYVPPAGAVTTPSTSSSSSSGITTGTAVATTSGTEIDFTGIPSTAKRITIMFNGISTNGTSPQQIQIGSGSYDTSGYNGTYWFSGGGGGTFTTGFGIKGSAATDTFFGHMILTHMGSNLWVASGTVGVLTAGLSSTMGGTRQLAGAIDRLRLINVNGTDTFDAGSMNIMWES